MYARKEQAREEDRENLRLLAASRADPDPMSSDIRAITEVNMAEAGLFPLRSTMPTPSSILKRGGGFHRGGMARSMDASSSILPSRNLNEPFFDARGEAY